MRSLSRVLMPLLASLLALAQLADHVHLAMVRHAVCAEHGELVEAPHAHGADRPADALDGVETHFDPVSTAVEAADHDHCLATLVTRQAATKARRVEVNAFPWVALVSVGASPRKVASSPVAPIRLAPKHSPPVA